MTITLLCPNGHKLVCPESQAGKRGKCPQCGAIFRVPEIKTGSSPGNSGIKIDTGAGSAPSAPVPIVVGPAAGSSPSNVSAAAETPEAHEEPANPIHVCAEGESPADGEIAFLCPNGHHLAGSVSLGGEPGKCPECGVKFLVPTEEELQQVEEPVDVFNPLAIDPASLMPASTPFGPAPEARPLMAQYFERLWGYKEHNAEIEVYLAGGTVLTPHGYAANLSRQAEGVFLIEEEDQSFAVAIVAWKSVTHVVVRGLSEPPPKVFSIP
ncbi:MAG: hypothetical protein JSS27_00825 [Planctomycetes bacterium]|nr:hypothetical protein [Planctomycetota bacterium]